MAEPSSPSKPAVADQVEIVIGKDIPSLAAKRGDKLKVTRDQAASFRERGMLLEQVEAQEAVRGARRAAAVSEEESKSGEALRRILKDTEAKLYTSREAEGRLNDELRKAQAHIVDLEKQLETARAEALRTAERNRPVAPAEPAVAPEPKAEAPKGKK